MSHLRLICHSFLTLPKIKTKPLEEANEAQHGPGPCLFFLTDSALTGFPLLPCLLSTLQPYLTTPYLMEQLSHFLPPPGLGVCCCLCLQRNWEKEFYTLFWTVPLNLLLEIFSAPLLPNPATCFLYHPVVGPATTISTWCCICSLVHLSNVLKTWGQGLSLFLSFQD